MTTADHTFVDTADHAIRGKSQCLEAWRGFFTSFPEESEHLLVRADLLIQLQTTLASRGLKQAEAAKVLRVTQPRVSDLLRGRIDLFSTDALIDMLARLGVGIRLVVKPARSRVA